jgi:V/A-type H+/Na+-transporting ATPase subunit I
MAIVVMSKIKLLLHESIAEKALEILQKLGAVEFTEIEEAETNKLLRITPNVIENNEELSQGRLDQLINFLSGYNTKRFSLKKMIEGDGVVISDVELDRVVSSSNYRDIVENVAKLEEDARILDNQRNTLLSENELLTHWLNLQISLSNGVKTRLTETFFLTGSEHEFVYFESALNKEKIPNFFFEASTTNRSCTILESDKEKFNKIFNDVEIEIVSLPEKEGTPNKIIDENNKLLQVNESKRLILLADIKNLIKHLPGLKMLSDYNLWTKDRTEKFNAALSTDTVKVFEAWCPTELVETVKKELSKFTSFFELTSRQPKDDEMPPVELKNNALIKPFESITRLYGVPSYRDLDPTPFLAVFFFVFFGLSLTDFVYGLLLAVMLGVILMVYRVPSSAKPLVSLLFLGGVSSALIGMLFGGYMGIPVTFFPQWMQNIQYFDSLKNPLPIFYLSLGLGVLQIIFGIILAVLRDARLGSLWDGVLNHVPWILMFISIGVFYFMSFVWPLYASIAILVLTQGRKEKSIFKKITMGTVSLYEVVGYFSDVLSYSRLLALGLATSALAFAVNLTASLVREMIPYVGVLLVPFIYIGGHLFNLAVNILGAFIHSARLQFVEFFSKFITGSGKPFVAFGRGGQYVTLK